MDPIGVIVLEDDPATRERVVRSLRSDARFAVVHEGATVEGGALAIARGDAQLGLFDLGLADGSSIALLPTSVERGIAVVVITHAEDDDTVFGAIVAGARGYVLKSDVHVSIGDALYAVHEGGSPISPRIASRLLDRYRHARADDGVPMTPREREVAELFAKGATYAEVGRALGVSVNTVRHHVRSLYDKLHVASKAELVARLGRSKPLG